MENSSETGASLWTLQEFRQLGVKGMKAQMETHVKG